MDRGERLDRLGPDWPHRERSELVPAADMRFHVQRFGERGPRVLLLHGTGASTHSFRQLAPLLGASARVLACDLPGHGASETPRGDGLSMAGMARRVAALCDRVDFAPDVIVGHSAGVAIAIEASTERLLRPRLIVGINAALQPMQGYALFSPLAKFLVLNPLVPSLFAASARRERTVRRLLDGTGSKLDAEGLDYYARLFRRTDHVHGALGMMAGWDLEGLRKRMPGLRSRLVLIVAEDDGTVPARDADAHVARVRDGALMRVPRGGHLVHETNAPKVALLVQRAMDEAGLHGAGRDGTTSAMDETEGSPPPTELT